MNELGVGQAIILGVVQGVSEFLPISSSGHLAIVQRWMNLAPDSRDLLLFDVFAHVGTLAAVLIVFEGSIRALLVRLVAESKGLYGGRRLVGWRIVGLGAIATLTTGAVALPYKDVFEAAFGQRSWIGWFLIVTGLVLAGTGIVPSGRRGWREFRWWHAVLIGLAQTCAIFPGISRSGATICMALFCGIRRRWAGEFSFLIAIPAILGAAGAMMTDLGPAAGEAQEATVTATSAGAIAVGAIVATATGVVALRWLLALVRRGRLILFAPYCIVVGVLVVLRIL